MRVYDERQFTGIENLDKAFRMNKRITTTVIIIIPVLVTVFVIALFTLYFKTKNTLYVLTKDDVAVVERTTVKANREVEGKMHMKKFYQTFLEMDPNWESINASLEECYYLGGDDIKQLATRYKESGFYNDIIRQNIMIRQELKFENIQVNTKTYPYEVIAKGKQILIRKSNTLEKTFFIRCNLYNLDDRTEMNPHAFWIDNLMILDNSEIE